MSFTKKYFKPHKPDFVLLITLTIIIILGIVMLSSASSVVGYEKFNDSAYFVKHQLFFGLIPGIIIFVILSKINYQIYKGFAPLLLFISIILLLAVFLPKIGYDYLGAKRWLRIGFLQFQPAEIVKLTFLLYLARWMEKRGQDKVKNFSDGLIPFITVLGIILGLIILQPDVGTASIIVAIALIVYFIAGAKIKHLFGLILIGIGFLFVLIKMAPYRAARLKAFLDPSSDPLGIGYHINQALIAVGSGGLWGLGFGKSRQKHLYLPEVVGDSIFAVMAEELGFFVVLVVIFCFIILIHRGIAIAKRSKDLYGSLVAGGITGWIGTQAFVNIAAMLGIMPLTGLPLPFISYGSTALVMNLAAMGILTNISMYTVDKQNKVLVNR